MDVIRIIRKKNSWDDEKIGWKNMKNNEREREI